MDPPTADAMSVWSRPIVVAVVLVAAVVAPRAQDAHAHGKVPDLVAYCKSKHPRVIPLSGWRVTYDTKRRLWLCIERQPHFQAGYVDNEFPLDVADACWTQFRMPQVHFHEGSNVKSPAAVHCGIVHGTVSKPPPAPEPSVLKLCNASRESKIYAAFAAWDADASRGWTTKGWYELARNQCRSFELGRPYVGQVFVYAEVGGRVWGTGG